MLGLKGSPLAEGLGLKSLPRAVAEPVAAMEKRLAHRAQLLAKLEEIDREAPALAHAAAAAQAALEGAEIDLACSTDLNFDELTRARDEKRVAADAAAERLAMAQRQRRGLAARLNEIDTEIADGWPAFNDATVALSRAVVAAFEKLLESQAKALADLLTLGHALMDRLPDRGFIRTMLDEVNLRAVTVESAGRRLIDGHRAHLGGAPRDLRVWRDNRQAAAVAAILEPMMAAHNAAKQIVREMERDRGRARETERPAPPAVERPPAPPAEEITVEQIQRERAEQVNRNRLYPPPGPRPTYSDYRDRLGR
jgi:hypothetical protein